MPKTQVEWTPCPAVQRQMDERVSTVQRLIATGYSPATFFVEVEREQGWAPVTLNCSPLTFDDFADAEQAAEDFTGLFERPTRVQVTLTVRNISPA